MATSPAVGATPAGNLDSALEDRLEWSRSHGGPRPGWTPRAVLAAFGDVVAPPAPPPAWLLASLTSGEPLTLQRLELPRPSGPEFEVATRSGHPLGRLAGAPAAMIDAGLAVGVLPKLSVLIADPSRPPAQRLQLTLELIVWLAPGEPLGPLRVYDERGGEHCTRRREDG